MIKYARVRVVQGPADAGDVLGGRREDCGRVTAYYVTDAGIVDCDRVRASFSRFGVYEVRGHGGATITIKALGSSGIGRTMYRFNLTPGRPWNTEPWNAVKHIRHWNKANDDELLALHAVAVREFNLHKKWGECLFIEKALEFHGITKQMGWMAGIKLLMAERDVFRPNGGQKDK